MSAKLEPLGGLWTEKDGKPFAEVKIAPNGVVAIGEKGSRKFIVPSYYECGDVFGLISYERGKYMVNDAIRELDSASE